MYNKKSITFRLLTIILLFALTAPVSVNAAVPETVQPHASLYLDNYAAYVYLPGGGPVRVYFDVEGTGYMDEIGALNIEVWESVNGTDWTWVRSFTHDLYPGMLSYNDDFHANYVTYYGIPGRYYKAYVCVWAGKNGSGDTRYFWTSVKQ